MKVCGLITEYNPFHRGHQIHLNKALELTGADYTIAIMSGDFVQRGEPALFNKYYRTAKALEAGVDMVIELPLVFSLSDAGNFANGGIMMLNSLGIVNSICFGSNTHMEKLEIISAALYNESPLFKAALKEGLKEGLSYPAARERALIETSDLNDNEVSSIMGNANSTLGLEYLNSIKKQEAPIEAFTYNRWHEKGEYSATFYRNLIRNEKENIINLMPELYSMDAPVPMLEIKDFSSYFSYILAKEEDFSKYRGVSEELSNRIIQNREEFTDLKSFATLLKSKNFTYSHISRALMNIILDMKKSEISATDSLKTFPYCHILGVRKRAKFLIGEINRASNIKTLVSLKERKELADFADAILEKDVFASRLYDYTVAGKYFLRRGNEYEQQVIVRD